MDIDHMTDEEIDAAWQREYGTPVPKPAPTSHEREARRQAKKAERSRLWAEQGKLERALAHKARDNNAAAQNNDAPQGFPGPESRPQDGLGVAPSPSTPPQFPILASSDIPPDHPDSMIKAMRSTAVPNPETLVVHSPISAKQQPIIKYMVENPGQSLGAVAAANGVSSTWLANVADDKEFQGFFLPATTEKHERATFSEEQRRKALHAVAADRLSDIAEQSLDGYLLVQILKETKAPPAQATSNTNFVVVMPQKPGSVQEWMEQCN